MKRLILCAVAVLLTSGALATRPAFACVIDPACYSSADCIDVCGYSAPCNTCSGLCRC
jgi:hypothetical protein